MKKLLLFLTIIFAFALRGVAQQNSFAPQGAEWYFNVWGFMGAPDPFYHMEVLGDTLIQGHQCSVITGQFLGGNGDQQYVYEDNRVVYWYNQTMQAFTTLYDFDADEGDSWICEVDSCSFVVHVQSVEEVTWEGHTYRVQRVSSEGGVYYNDPAFNGAIIEGIGYERGLFPYPWACSSSIYCGGYTNYLRCYLVNDEMLYHGGYYDCEEYGNCWDGTVANDFAGGDGTEGNPYLIATAKQLAMFAQRVNIGMGSDAYYKLTENINLQRCDVGHQQWESIGTVVHPFAGHFDGDGHTILNMSQNITNGNSLVVAGLFGCTNGAEISNVHLTRCYVLGNARYAGTLVGYAGLTNISNCSIYDGSSETSNGIAGGLVGFAGYTYGLEGASEETYTIANCVVMGAVKVNGSATGGGIVGRVSDLDAKASYVIVGCSMEGTSDNYYIQGGVTAGGIVGQIVEGLVKECTNHQKVVGGDSHGGGCIGGVVGLFDIGDVLDCINYGQVVSTENYLYVNAGGIAGGSMGTSGYPNVNIINCQNYADVTGTLCCGGIIGSFFGGMPSYIQNCHNLGRVTSNSSRSAGGIIGSTGGKFRVCYIVDCSNAGDVVVNYPDQGSAGGILGEVSNIDEQIYILNVYNRGMVSSPQFAGGILGGDFESRNCIIQNVYNTGEVITGEETKGAIAYIQQVNDHFSDCYWLGVLDNHAGVSEGEPLQHSCAFWPTTYFGEWSLDSLQFGHDLVQALNAGAEALVEQYPAVLTMVHRWEYDVDNINDGYPVLSGIEMVDYPFDGTEWYYEIQNENGTITYQHLEYTADTTINDNTVVIIIRTNTLYDKDKHQEVTREYLYEEDGVVYWWNKDLQEFTTLYDFGAETGDEWEINVGMESITMHVDSVRYYEYDGELYRMLMVSDENCIFSGNIVCGIGHQTSFFPERLMAHNKGYRVEGIRCYWREGELVFKYGDRDCDEVYQEYHNGIEEDGPSAGSGTLTVYPNPTHSVLFVETRRATSLQAETYRITNLMGQTLMTGTVTTEVQRIDVSNLSEGMYFISVGDTTRKFVVR